MAFPFRCPHCGATSRVQETSLGESGLCYQCGNAITVFPPSSDIAPPRPITEGVYGATACGACFVALFLFLRSIPMWVAMSATGTLTTMEIVTESLRTLIPGLVGAVIGGLALFSAAASVNTQSAFRILRRAILAGAAAGALIGTIGGIIVSMRNPSIRFFPQGELISAAICCGITLVGILGGAIGLPIAVKSERKLVQQAAFTAPKPTPAIEEPLLAEVVEAPPAAPTPRAELSSQRRQELIRRLGIVHADEPPDHDPTPQDDADPN